ncbi:LacI family DNA-binding transcriptional regulator [Amycolatopsis orientalis]|uniref:LacI family DNA-binding transcriptional regulator n=1 Tax=Amycolatopsis orientalis TaxID=31958 RepID=UPI00039FFA26|nr:LacI family DNA-binding transcriptional regulator [Amycolatopsis orientalis]
MANRRPTQADVARRAGVSRTTASFVLTGRADMRISSDAQQRVLRAAQDLGYRPNLAARSLRTNVTGTIALVSDVIATSQFAGEVIQGAMHAALARDHLVFTVETLRDPELETRLIERMKDQQVDGFLYALMGTDEIELPAALRDTNVVLVNCTAANADLPAVMPDEVNAGRTAGLAVLDAGIRDEVYVIGGHHRVASHPDGVVAGNQRMAGIEAVFRQAGARLAGVAECGPWVPDQGFEAVDRLLAEGIRPNALICSNDRLALGAYQALAGYGLRIPEDVSVVSFDDSELASWLRPQLTSVALPHYQFGHRAVELLISGQLSPSIYHLPMPIRIRGSLAGPRP